MGIVRETMTKDDKAAGRNKVGKGKRSTYDTITGRFLFVPRDEALCEAFPCTNCSLPDSAPDESPSGLCRGSVSLSVRAVCSGEAAAVFGIVI